MKKETKDILLHLRLPFSYFLLPIFLFGLSQSDKIDIFNSVIVFVALHFFIYPASNAYNSYMDQDEGSIGALKNPPPASRGLYLTSIFLDITGLLLTLLVDFRLTLITMLYIFVSKAYSWDKIRLKKFPLWGWLMVVIFQGGYTFLIVSMCAENNFSTSWLTHQKLFAAGISTLLIGAYYPLTQIYQHTEDSLRGDITISYKLGIIGTFIFSGLLFIVSFVFSFIYFQKYFFIYHFLIFMLTLLPAILFFLYWFWSTFKDNSKADFKNAMRMTFLSSTCLIVCFTILLLINHS